MTPPVFFFFYYYNRFRAFCWLSLEIDPEQIRKYRMSNFNFFHFSMETRQSWSSVWKVSFSHWLYFIFFDFRQILSIVATNYHVQNFTRIPMDTTPFILLHVLYFSLKDLTRTKEYLMIQSKINAWGVREKNKESSRGQM